MSNESQKTTGKDLRAKFGVFGLSIIQIVGLIMILAIIVTVAYQFV